MVERSLNATELTALVVAAIGAIGAVVLQALHMYLAYRRDISLKGDVKAAVDQTAAVAATAEAVESKLDDNTAITKETKEAATAVGQHNEACNTEITRLATVSAQHHDRISALEGQMARLAVTVEAASKNVDSTRHEMRTNLQTVMNKLDGLMMLAKMPAEAIAAATAGTPSGASALKGGK